MRKLTSFLLLLTTIVLILSSCGYEKLKIENYDWKMRYVMHGGDNQVVIDAVGEDDPSSDAKTVHITLKAENGKITVTDSTNNRTYEGSYTVSGKTPREIKYNVVIDGIAGHGAVAMTTYYDGKEEPTLPISLGDYSIYFYAQ